MNLFQFFYFAFGAKRDFLPGFFVFMARILSISVRNIKMKSEVLPPLSFCKMCSSGKDRPLPHLFNHVTGSNGSAVFDAILPAVWLSGRCGGLSFPLAWQLLLSKREL